MLSTIRFILNDIRHLISSVIKTFKCLFFNHNWGEVESVKVKRKFLSRVLTDYLHYRECKNCKLKQKKYTLFNRNWEIIEHKPKELRYNVKIDLNESGKKELKTFMKEIEKGF